MNRDKSVAMGIVLLGIMGLIGPRTATAGDDDSTQPAQPAVNKNQYNLFNPTPENLLRDLNSDRPDVTEGPFTVDAGHLQVELSWVEYTYDDDHGSRTEEYNVLPTNFRLGVLNNVDLEFMAQPYQNVLIHGAGNSERDSGLGDSQIRSTINLWGNDGGVTAGGLIPFVTVPTGDSGLSDHHVEYGLILPLAVNLPGDFDLGTQAEFDVDRNDPNTGYGVDFVHTVELEHQLFLKSLSAYVEYVGVSPINTDRTYQSFVDGGFLYLLNEDVQLDIGINVGVSAHAPDFTVFSGLTFRI